MSEYESIMLIGLLIILVLIIVFIVQKKIRKDEYESGWDMFCEDHFEEAKEHIQKKHPECEVGWCEATRDEEFDDDESMRCGYPDCIKESKYEIHWIDTRAWGDLRSSEYIPLGKDEEMTGDV